MNWRAVDQKLRHVAGYVHRANRFLWRVVGILIVAIVLVLALQGALGIYLARQGAIVTQDACDQQTDDAVRSICEDCLCREDLTFCRVRDL